MKKFAISFVAVFAIFAFAGSASAVSATEIYSPSTGLLMVGSGMGAKAYQSANVMAAQKALNACVAGSNLKEDGKFGPLTKGIFATFQASKGIKVDGIIGAQTAATLAACSEGTSTGGSTTTGSLSGGAGDLSINPTSADTEDTVQVGKSDVIILAGKAKANGSDIAISNVRVNFNNNPSGSSSNRLNRYVDEVSVWLGDKKVGSADVDEFTKDGNDYYNTISLSNAVVEEGKTLNLYVAVDAKSAIDSTDINYANWDVKLQSVRYKDATGAILSDSDLTSGIVSVSDVNFEKLATSGDINVKVTEGSNNPKAQNVKVSENSATSNVTLLEFKIKAEGSDVTFDSLPIDIKSSTDVDAVIDELVLKNGSTELESLSGSDIPSSITGTVTFDLDDEFTIDAGDTETFTVVAKFKKLDTNYDQGTTVEASFTAANAEAVNFEDENGDNIVDDDITGSSIGYEQKLFSEGVNVSGFKSSVNSTSDNNGAFTKQTYTVEFTATAFGNDYYIPKSVVKTSGTLSNGQGLAYVVENSAGTEVTNTSASASSLNSNADTVGGYFKVADGQTKTFTATIELGKGSAAAGFYRVQLLKVAYDLDQSGTPSAFTLTPSQDYESADRKLD